MNDAHPKRSTAHSLLWTVGRTGGVALIQFIVLIVVSRQLGKVEVGWSAALITVNNLAQLLASMGLVSAIIQRPKLSDAHIASSFIAAMGVGLLQTTLLIVLAHPVAQLFGLPEIVPYLQVSALAFAVAGLYRVQQAVLERDLRFDKSAKAALISGYAYGGVTIAGVYLGWSVWAVVAGLIIQQLAGTIAVFVGERWPKPIRFDKVAYKEMMSIAHAFNAANILHTLASNIDNFVVSRWLGPVALGEYSRAFQLMARPATLLSKSITTVMWPTMARSQVDPKNVIRLYEKTTAGVATLVLPTGLLLAVLAPEVVQVVLGRRWLDSVVVPFQILAAGMYFRSGNVASDAALGAVGKASSRVIPKGVFAASVVLFAIAGLPWGIVGVSWGVLAANVLHTLLMAHVCVGSVGSSWGRFLAAHRAAVILSIAMAGVAMLLMIPLRDAGILPWVRLLVGLFAGFGMGVALFLWAGEKVLGPETRLLKESLRRLSKRDLT